MGGGWCRCVAPGGGTARRPGRGAGRGGGGGCGARRRAGGGGRGGGGSAALRGRGGGAGGAAGRGAGREGGGRAVATSSDIRLLGYPKAKRGRATGRDAGDGPRRPRRGPWVRPVAGIGGEFREVGAGQVQAETVAGPYAIGDVQQVDAEGRVAG